MSNARWEVGRIGKPRGLKGEVRLHLDRSDPIYLQPSRAFVQLREGEPTLRSIEVLAFSGKTAVIRVEGADDRLAAEALQGATFSVDADWFTGDPRPPEKLIGSQVVHADSGDEIGRVTDFYDNGAQVVLAISAGEVERLVPFVDEFVVDVSGDDPPVIRIRPIPGLLEDLD